MISSLADVLKGQSTRFVQGMESSAECLSYMSVAGKKKVVAVLGFDVLSPAGDAMSKCFNVAGKSMASVAFNIKAIAERALSFFSDLVYKLTGRSYDSSRILSSYREEAKNLPLCEVFRRHKENVAAKKILTQDQFMQKYVEEVKTLTSLEDFVKHHQAVSHLSKDSFFLPAISDLIYQEEAPKPLQVVPKKGFSIMNEWSRARARAKERQNKGS